MIEMVITASIEFSNLSFAQTERDVLKSLFPKCTVRAYAGHRGAVCELEYKGNIDYDLEQSIKEYEFEELEVRVFDTYIDHETILGDRLSIEQSIERQKERLQFLQNRLKQL